MKDGNRVRIIYDPYNRNIEYSWYNSNAEDYEELEPETSALARDEYTNTTIQSRAYEIIEILDKAYNPGNIGLTIFFIGTIDDYNDFCDVIKMYNSDVKKDKKDNSDRNIECTRDEKYFKCASDVMTIIKDKFGIIQTTLEEYAEDDIIKWINKYNDTIKTSISLCVMGLYSSGKSAFINSLIGEELLPSASDPTTGSVFKITCGKKYSIRFLFDDKECILTFEGNKYKSNSNFEKEVIRNLQEIVQIEGFHSEIMHMNKALEIIDDYKKENHSHKISDTIEIEVPFYRTRLPVDDFDFVIFDTPGSNSDSNINHFKVLKESLDEQTNALPVFLTMPDSMDSKDNGEILELIEKTGTALDTTNAIVVVNRADEKAIGELDKKKEKYRELKITKWKSTRIFFVSALIGIASKKDNPNNEDEWLNKDMLEIYEEKKGSFISDKKKLYQFNIVDESKNILEEMTKEMSETERLYRNSGLASVEQAIIEYAKKYALYNKCKQASEYLQKAIDLCVENVEETKQRLKCALNEAEKGFDEKHKFLVEELEEKKKDLGKYNAAFQSLVSSIYMNYTVKKGLDKKTLYDMTYYSDFKREWKKLTKESKENNKEKNWRFNQIQSYVNQHLNDILKEFSMETNQEAHKFWDEKSKQFKEGCCKVISDSNALVDEQKKILESVILNTENMSIYSISLDLRAKGAIRKKRFLFWKTAKDKFDVWDCCYAYRQRFDNEVRSMTSTIETKNQDNFKNWADNLIIKLKQEICNFNSELREYKEKMSELENDIKTKEDCKDLLESNKENIDALFEMQEESDAE